VLKRLVGTVTAVVMASTLPVSASSREATWSLSAPGNRASELTLTSAVEFALDDAIIDIGTGRRNISSVLSLTGSYGGIVIRDRRGQVRVGVARLMAVPGLVLWGTHDGKDRQILEPGRYTVTTFADRTLTAHLPLRSRSSLTLRTTAPARETVAYRTDTGLVSNAGPWTDLEVSLRLTPRANYFVLGYTTSPLPLGDVSSLCITDPSDHTCSQSKHAYTGPTVIIGQDTYEGSALTSPDAGWLPAGNYVARYLEAHTPTSGHYLLTVTLP
jgi:hypothetical protein